MPSPYGWRMSWPAPPSAAPNPPSVGPEFPRPVLARGLLHVPVALALVLGEAQPLQVLVAQVRLGLHVRPLARDVRRRDRPPHRLARLGLLGQRRVLHRLE